MKNKKLLLLVLSSIALIACEPVKHISKPKKITTYDENNVETFRQEFKYDSKGNVTKEENYHLDEEVNQMVMTSYIDTTYENDRVLKEEWYEADDNNVMVLECRYVYEYDTKGVLTGTKEYRLRDGETELKLDSYYEYTYDSKERVTEKKYFETEDGQTYPLSTLVSYEYSGDFDKFVKCTATSYSSGEATVLYVNERTLDAKGNIATEIADMGFSITKDTYEYNSYNYVTNHSTYTSEDGTNYKIYMTSVTKYVDQVYERSTTATYYEDGVVDRMYKDEYTYKANKDISEYNQYSMDINTSELTVLSRDVYSY